MPCLGISYRGGRNNRRKDIEDLVDNGPDCHPERNEGSLEILRRSAPQNDNSKLKGKQNQ
jgi:hypothetical protein